MGQITLAFTSNVLVPGHLSTLNFLKPLQAPSSCPNSVTMGEVISLAFSLDDYYNPVGGIP